MAFRKAYSYLKYSLKKLGRNYNVLERKDKVMDIEKRAAAPRHPGTQTKISVLLKQRPEIVEEAKSVPQDHLFRLKDVRVEADSIPPPEDETKSKHDLPQDREQRQVPLYGYEEPEFIPEGKCTLKQALEFICNNHKDPEKFSANAIAQQYNLKVSDVEQVLKNFMAFELRFGSQKRTSLTKEAMDILGITKVRKPSVYQKFSHLEEGRKKIAETTDKSH